ncbi:MAG: exodeoxyribonuclease V subunit gamma [Mogibacterium sp.]|nr:exodeoxyribonuclease V subunit gamma [Mogibacterium sp.]
MLTICSARERVDKERYLYDHIRGEALVIVPDQYTLIAEEQALRYLGVTCLLDVEILSMSRLGLRVLTEQGQENVRVLDRYERYMILAAVIREHRDELEIFRKAAGKRTFVEMVHDFIADYKQQGCTMEQIDAMIASEETGPILRRKLQELRLLTEAYEDRIRSTGHEDNEDYINRYIEAIGASDWIRNKQVWVYGFDSLTPKMMQAVAEIAARAAETSVILNESDFGLDREMARRLQDEAAARGVACESRQIGDEIYRLRKAPAICKVERELFRRNPAGRTEDGLSDPGDAIRIVECANPYYEAESAAAYICGLLRDEHYRMNEIVLISNDADNLHPIIKRTFEEYGLPVFVDAARSIRDTQVVGFLVSQLEAVCYDYRTPAILTMLKSGLSGLSEEAVWELENYVKGYRIRGNMWARGFRYGSHEYEEEELAAIDRSRAEIVGKLQRLQELIRQSENVAVFVERYYRYLNEEWDLRNQVEALKDRQYEQGRIEESQRTAQSYNEAIRVLDRVRDILGQEPMEIDTFLLLYTEGINRAEIGLIPPTVDGLSLGTMIRTRPAPPRAVVVLGANEGVLPLEPQTEGLFSAGEKSWFEAQAFALGSLDRIRLLEENVALYRMLTRPSEKLYLSYSMSKADGSELRPAVLIEDLRKLFPALRIERDIVSAGYDMAQIQSSREALRHTLNHFKRTAYEESPEASAHAEYVADGVIAWFEANEPAFLERILAAGRDENQVDPLPQELARRLFARLGKPFSFSASRLERQFRCPFRHFVGYGLSPEEPREFRGGPREIGDIYHECIMRVSRRLMEAKQPEGPQAGGRPEASEDLFAPESLAAMVDEELHALSGEYRGGLFLSGGREEYRMARIREICEDAVKVLAEQLRTGKIRLAFFEEPFGRGCRFEPIEYTLHGEKIYIEGKIDRIDILEGGNIRIIDYKTGGDTLDLDQMRIGYKMQLAVYMQGAESGTYGPAGMFYFNIKDAELKANGLTEEKQEDELRKQDKELYRLRGAYINEEEILESMPASVIDRKSKALDRASFEALERDVHKAIESISDSIVRGDISISPTRLRSSDRVPECRNCTYRAICKFDQSYRENNYRLI